MATVPRRSVAAVTDTRAAVVHHAVRRASVEGLEGLTIGHLAADAGMSKSGLHGLFGTKERLQLATLEAGIEVFWREVYEPVRGEPAGRTRLLALCDRWLDFHRRRVLPGGCFMTTAMVEYDARPGVVRSAVAEAQRAWLGLLARHVDIAVEQGELPAGTEAADTAFALNALAAAASTHFHLFKDPDELARARRLMGILLA